MNAKMTMLPMPYPGCAAHWVNSTSHNLSTVLTTICVSQVCECILQTCGVWQSSDENFYHPLVFWISDWELTNAFRLDIRNPPCGIPRATQVLLPRRLCLWDAFEWSVIVYWMNSIVSFVIREGLQGSKWHWVFIVLMVKLFGLPTLKVWAPFPGVRV